MAVTGSSGDSLSEIRIARHPRQQLIDVFALMAPCNFWIHTWPSHSRPADEFTGRSPNNRCVRGNAATFRFQHRFDGDRPARLLDRSRWD